jgi:hypothetical protein
MNKIEIGDMLRRRCGTLYKVVSWNASEEEGEWIIIEQGDTSHRVGSRIPGRAFHKPDYYTADKPSTFNQLYNKLSS